MKKALLKSQSPLAELEAGVKYLLDEEVNIILVSLLLSPRKHDKNVETCAASLSLIIIVWEIPAHCALQQFEQCALCPRRGIKHVHISFEIRL